METKETLQISRPSFYPPHKPCLAEQVSGISLTSPWSFKTWASISPQGSTRIIRHLSLRRRPSRASSRPVLFSTPRLLTHHNRRSSSSRLNSNSHWVQRWGRSQMDSSKDKTITSNKRSLNHSITTIFLRIRVTLRRSSSISLSSSCTIRPI